MQFKTLIFLFMLSLPAMAQEGFRGEHFIEVTGTADMEIDPNEIVVQIRLREFEENRTKVSLEKLDDEFLAAIKTAGIDRKRLMLSDAGARLSQIGRRDKDAFRSKTYQVKLTSGSELATFVEKINSVKVDQVVILRTTHTEIEKFKLDLKIKALQAARTKADLLARSINAEIGKPLMIRDWENEVQPLDNTIVANVRLEAREYKGDIAEEEDPIAFKKIRLRAQINAQFEIK